MQTRAQTKDRRRLVRSIKCDVDQIWLWCSKGPAQRCYLTLHIEQSNGPHQAELLYTTQLGRGVQTTLDHHLLERFVHTEKHHIWYG